MSTKPMLGYKYLETHAYYHKSNSNRFYVVLKDGIKLPLPRNFKLKLYDKTDISNHAERCAENALNRLDNLRTSRDFIKFNFDKLATQEHFERNVGNGETL